MTALAEQARTDAVRYAANLAQPDGWEACARIEQDWALYGYPPEVVSTVLAAVADGDDFAAAESLALQTAAPPTDGPKGQDGQDRDEGGRS